VLPPAQHPDQQRAHQPILLGVDQQLCERASRAERRF
jgi:hypothetical protein